MRKTWTVCAAGMLLSSACGQGNGIRADAGNQQFVPPDGGPVFGPTVTFDPAPPPISGGTLTIARDGHTAVAADPDRDQISVVDLTTLSVVGTVSLSPGDEPGRVVETTDGRFLVALRRGGAVVAVGADGMLQGRATVCPAPRGVAYDPTSRNAFVACAGGELVTLVASDLTVTRTLHLEPDLRDVIVDGATLRVSQFRSAHLLTVDADGTVVRNEGPYRALAYTDAGIPDVAPGGPLPANTPHVAWRTLRMPGGEVLMVHQSALNLPVHDEPGSEDAGGGAPYGSNVVPADAGPLVSPGCGHTVDGLLTEFSQENPYTDRHIGLDSAALPVDVAVSHAGDALVVVAAGNARLRNAPTLYHLRTDRFADIHTATCNLDDATPELAGTEPIAVAFDGNDQIVVQTREPAALYLIGRNRHIVLSTVTRADTGHDVFHTNTGTGLACASCHPEGGDDGHVWNFSVEGTRRTQNLRGGLSGTEPFHWDGTLTTIDSLMGEIFHRRMGGPLLASDQIAALQRWTDAIPLLPVAPPVDPAAVERGRQLFNDAATACASCHSGEHFTNNVTTNVGTGGGFQVPRLNGLWARAPYMHNGCAASLRDRFGACGGGVGHGHTEQLSTGQIDDLLAYLETL